MAVATTRRASGASLVVKGSASSGRTVGAAPTWHQRLLAWVMPRSAQAAPPPAGSPVSMVLTFHSLHVSVNADCTDPYVLVQRFDLPRSFDLVDNPTLFAGSPPPGTYRCVIFEMDDILTIRPDAEAATTFPGQCEEGRDHVTDLYRAPDNDYRNLAGDPINAVGTRAAPGRQRVFTFASYNLAVKARVDSCRPSEHQSVLLSSPLVVPTQTTLYLDATNGVLGDVEDGVPFCVVERGQFGFR